MILSQTVSPDGKVLTVKWAPIAGARGYQFSVDGKNVSHTMDPTVTSTRFAIQTGSHSYEVTELLAGDKGASVYPAVVTPPPPPPPPPPPSGQVLWSGAPIGGKLVPPWAAIQARAGATYAVGIAPYPPTGKQGLRFEVRQGDFISPLKTDLNRAQLLGDVANTALGEGQEAYWGVDVYFDPTYNPDVTSYPLWNEFFQFQHQGFAGQAPLNFSVDAAQKHLVLTTNCGDPAHPTQKVWTLDTAFRPAVNYSFGIHIVASSNPNVGWLEVMLNGRVVVAGQHMATLFNDQTPLIVVQQLYRQAHTDTAIVFETPARRGTSYAAVA